MSNEIDPAFVAFPKRPAPFTVCVTRIPEIPLLTDPSLVLDTVMGAAGFADPTPMYPLPCWITVEDAETITPPRNVEVAVVVVAKIYETVGDDEAFKGPVPPFE